MLRRGLFWTGFLVGLLLLAGLGVSISLVRSIRSAIPLRPILTFERSAAQ